MKNAVKIIGIVAGAVAAAAIITRKRSDGTSLFDDIAHAGKGIGDKLVQYGNQLKDKFMPGLKGPNGEDVYADMYSRQYYLDDMNNRVYLDQA